MRAVIGEYGKVIILSALLCLLVMFLFGKGEHGFLGILSQAKPVEQVGHEDAFETAEAIALRAVPELSVETKKLKRGVEYNLLDAEMFRIRAENEDGEKVDLSIIKVVDPSGKDISSKTAVKRFLPEEKGTYQVIYRAKETYLGSVKASEKTYRFIVD